MSISMSAYLREKLAQQIQGPIQAHRPLPARTSGDLPLLLGLSALILLAGAGLVYGIGHHPLNGFPESNLDLLPEPIPDARPDLFPEPIPGVRPEQIPEFVPDVIPKNSPEWREIV